MRHVRHGGPPSTEPRPNRPEEGVGPGARPRTPAPRVKSGTMNSSTPTSALAVRLSASPRAVPAIAGRGATRSTSRPALATSRRPRNTSAWVERAIVAGSRRSPLAAGVERRRRSAKSVRRRPHVPLVGVAGDHGQHAVALAADQDRQRRCTGFGSASASVTRSGTPWTVVVGRAAGPRAPGAPPRSGRCAPPGAPSVMPYCSCSFSCQPAPTPSSRRPPLTWSTVAAHFASDRRAGR